MATKFVSRQNVIVILGAVMIICLALTVVTFAVALIWIGQPLGGANWRRSFLIVKLGECFQCMGCIHH
jgi:hypothetical protein